MSQDEGGFNGPSPFRQSCWLLLFVWHKELLVQQSCKDQVSLSELSSSPSASQGKVPPAMGMERLGLLLEGCFMQFALCLPGHPEQCERGCHPTILPSIASCLVLHPQGLCQEVLVQEDPCEKGTLVTSCWLFQ